MNYEMDVIINRFVDCSTQILNDGILLIAENFPGQQNQIRFNVKKQEKLKKIKIIYLKYFLKYNW